MIAATVANLESLLTLYGLRPIPALVGGLLIAMALALATTAIRSLILSDRRRWGPTTRRFCRALRISSPQRRLLLRVARQAGVRGEASLLLSRGCFDAAAAGADPADAKRLAIIRRQVFETR